MNPLPPQLRKAGPSAFGQSSIAAKYAERPVEKLPAKPYYEEEEDPDLQCYIWDSRAQQPRRPVEKPQIRAPPPQKQRQLLSQVMEMGFDEASAKGALASTGWASVQDAVSALLGA
ncbi:unnamed protein product [Effrenium voratum]|nr:unnamed protein product [Effrenium voratum]